MKPGRVPSAGVLVHKALHMSLREAAARARAVLRGQPLGRIGPGVRISGPGRLDMGRGASIGRDTRIHIGPGAVLRMGPGSRISDRGIVNVMVGVTLGRAARLSWDVQILDSDFHSITHDDGSVSTPTRPILIDDRAFVGANSMILKGVTIGRGAVVGAGAVVPKSVEPETIVAGNPARVIGHGHRSDLGESTDAGGS